MPLEWRPLSAELIDVWLPLRTAIDTADGRIEFVTADDLRVEISSAWADLSRDSRIGFDSDGVARAFGMVELRPGDRTLLRAYCWGGVHPDWRGRGIGRELLDWQRIRASELAAERRAVLGDEVPAALRSEVPDGAPAIAALFRHAGLEPTIAALVMRRDLEIPVERLAPPDGLAIVPYDISMDDALRTAHNAFFMGQYSFQPWDQDAWRQWATGHRDFRPDWSFVVMARAEIVGYVLCMAQPGTWAALGWTQGYISRVGTAPSWRGRGIGTTLLSRAMTAFAADGMQFAGLDVDDANPTGALSLYRRMGFQEWHRVTLWDLRL